MTFLPLSDAGWIEGRGYRKQILLRGDELREDGTLVQLVEIAPGAHVPPHHHRTSLEVFHMISGSGTMTIGGVTHTLRPGDTITCEPPEIHSAENLSQAVWRYIVFKTNVSPEDTFWEEV